MMKQIFCFFWIFIFLTACSGLSLDDDTDRVDDDREGEVDLPEDLTEKPSLSGFLKNCNPELSVPDNTIDIITDMVGVSDKNPFRVARECLKARLEEGHDRICDARDKLEIKRSKARDERTKARVDNSLAKLDEIQFKFNQNLYELAVDIDDDIVVEEEKKDPKTWVGRVFAWGRQEESEALRDILDTESYSECNFYNNEDDDDD